VLILTAKGPSARKILDLVPNVRLYMDKPFEPADLLATVKRLLAAPPKS
jgi:DNA-binding response OmpR family regulator